MKQPLQQNINIKIRGGPPVIIPFSAQTSIPSVFIKEPEFNFGDIRYGNTGTHPMTITNEGAIPANLILDLREKEGVKELEGVDGLTIEKANKDNDNDQSYL